MDTRLFLLQLDIMRNDIFIFSVFIEKSARYRAELHKSQSMIQFQCRCIGLHDRIELQHTETQIFCLLHAVSHEIFSDMLTALSAFYGIRYVRIVRHCSDAEYTCPRFRRLLRHGLCRHRTVLQKSLCRYFRSVYLSAEIPRLLPLLHSRYVYCPKSFTPSASLP